MKKFLFLFAIALMGCINASAALTTGYYKIKNPGYSRYMYEDFATGGICTSTTCADTDYEKIWKLTVSGSTVTLQNVYTGHYAQKQSSTSAQFTTGTSAVGFTLTTNSDDTYMFSSGSYMHCAATQSYYVVNWWDASSTYSMWSVEAVSLTDAQVTSIRKEFTDVETLQNNASSYNSTLLNFFTDLSCSELKSTYRSYTDANLKKAMSSLPTALQDIAVKVKNNWSDETDGTMSKKFRVRDYQAYSRAAYWRGQLNATQFTDMNNPTGVYAKSKDVLYVFVGGDIPSNCQLNLASTTSNSQQSFAAGTTLKKGLNVVQNASDFAHQWIMYTYTGDTQVDMSTLDKLKIHIEGGDVYGFADITGLGESAANAEYKADLDHANTEADAKGADKTDLRFIVKGNRGVFYFPLDTYNQIWKTSTYYGSYTTNYNIYKSMRWFDNVLAWEWGIMGFTKRVYYGQTDEHEHVTGGRDVYPTYCNNLALTVQNASGTNPYSTTGYTSMPGVGGVESSYNAERADFDNWCVGHESGHNNQGAINLPSCTESSNNLFSNVVCYLHGYRMSRGEPVSTTNANYQSGTQFALRDIGSTHRMYWQLYLYYHEAQRKTDFYPTLFESLRNDGMNLNSGQCFLKFYQKACDAAGEDLTEFFRGWGFFEPFNNQVFGDYTSRTLTLTQAEIDAAIAAVKAKKYEENTAIMFIEDRIEQPYRFDTWANGTTDPRAVQGYAVGKCGELGSVNDYAPGATPTAANYSSYALDGNTLTMNGTGGAGFLVYDTDGNLVAFSNSKSFTISDDAVASGFTVKVVNADNTSEEVLSVTEAGTAEEQLEALQNAIKSAENITKFADETEKKVGFYKESALMNLRSIMNAAKSVVTNKTASKYAEYINALNQEIAAVKTNEKAIVKIYSGNYYSLQNYVYTLRHLTNSSGKLTSGGTAGVDADDMWAFEEVSGSTDTYYLKSKDTGKYISSLGTSTQGTVTAETTADALTFKLHMQDAHTFALESSAEGYKYLHSASSQSYKVVGWTEGATASHWYIFLEEESAENAANRELDVLIAQSQALLDKVVENVEADVNVSDLQNLQTTNSSNPFYITSNHEETTEGEIANMVDGDNSTFFHSTWSVATTDKHYWQIDLGAGNELDMFNITLTSRAKDPNNFPQEITVQASNDGTNFESVALLTNECASGGQVVYTSENVGVAGQKYRYYRFVVDKTTSGNGNNTKHTYSFFSLAEFKMSAVEVEYTFTLDSSYSFVDEDAVEDLYTELKNAVNVSEVGSMTAKQEELKKLQDYYDALKALLDNSPKELLANLLAKLDATTYLEGTDPGYYDVTALNEAKEEARAILNASTSTDADYNQQYAKLKEISNAIEMILPQEGKIYRIVSARSGWNREKAMTATTDTNGNGTEVHPGWEAKAVDDNEQLWLIVPTGVDGVYTVKNYRTGEYITSATELGTTAKNITLECLGSAQFKFTVEGSTTPLHCRYQVDGYSCGPLTEWTAELNNASAWYIEEVTMGDTNADKELTIIDVANLVQVLANGATATAPTDINNNGTSDAEDVTALGKLILKKK